MRKYFIAPACLFFLLAFTSHNANRLPAINKDSSTKQQDTVTGLVTIDLNNVFQTIHSFGASDCWTAKHAGQWKDERKKNAIADLLFSTENFSDGSPKGIGLSLWRFNIGAGSYEQGAASGIKDEYRREECFLGAEGKYDWGKEAGGQWFLEAAKKRAVKYLLAFTNSAPVQFTQNGLSYGLSNNNFSCKEDRYNAFADFLVEVCKHFKTTNIPFDYISPINEPQWKWGEHPNQEGSGATNEQTAAFIKLLGRKMQAAGLVSKITVGEAAQVNFLYGPNKNNIGNQLTEFFDPSSANYLGAVPNTEKLISYHSYFTTCPDTALFVSRQLVNEKRKSIDPAMQLWQSEFGVLGDICGKLNGGPRNTDINYGLYVAKVMHADLAIAGVSSFQWWLAINPYNYSDGLVYINAPDGSINPAQSKEDGIVSSSKQLWCMGNFSRFIRPGMKRVAATFSDKTGANNTILVSSYRNDRSKELVIVVINSGANETAIRLQTAGIMNTKRLDSYTTSATKNMKHTMVGPDKIVIAAMSVTTFVTKYE